MKILIIVDMQNDFISGALGTSEALAILPGVIARVIESRGELILFTQDTHCEDYLNTSEGKKLPVVHCVKDSWGWQIHEEIMAAWNGNPDTIRLNPPNSSSGALEGNIFQKPVFGSTALVDFLVDLLGGGSLSAKIELLGLCTDICVISNAIMIKNALPETEISVNANLSAATTPQSHLEALNIMEKCHIEVRS
jgi:nicotinamidase-related amidase